MNLNKSIDGFVVNKNSDGGVETRLQDIHEEDLQGDVTVDIEFSALNYKDALAATGHPGVALSLPLVPGIDAIGKVAESNEIDLPVGQPVIIAHADFGTRRHGGWCQQTKVPADWCIPIPDRLSKLESIALGTAGFTAAQCVESLVDHQIKPDSGPIVVTGSTGGVGIVAIKLLGQLGYDVVAATGKLDQSDWLKSQGAKEVVDRNDLVDSSGRPLLSAKWAGAVDTTGGAILETILRSCMPRACVTACGLVAGADINMTVYPFILRGVTLQGIDSAGLTKPQRMRIWDRLGSDWKLDGLEELTTQVELANVSSSVDAILAGKIRGRVVIVP